MRSAGDIKIGGADGNPRAAGLRLHTGVISFLPRPDSVCLSVVESSRSCSPGAPSAPICGHLFNNTLVREGYSRSRRPKRSFEII